MSRKCHGKVTEKSRKGHGKVTKASVGRQGDSKIQQPTHHPKTFLTLQEVLPPSVIPFWKPLMTPNLNPNSDAKIVQIFLQTMNMKTSRGPAPKCFIPFRKPLMTPNLNLNSDAKILQIFCNPFLQTHNMKTSRGPTPKCYTFLETSHDPQLKSQIRCQNFANFFYPYPFT